MLVQHCFGNDGIFCAPVSYAAVEGHGAMVSETDKNGQPFPNPVDVKRLGFQLQMFTDYDDESGHWQARQVGDQTLYSLRRCTTSKAGASCEFFIRLAPGSPTPAPPAGVSGGYLGVNAMSDAVLSTVLSTVKVRVVSNNGTRYVPLSALATSP